MCTLSCAHIKYTSQQILCPLNKHNPTNWQYQSGREKHSDQAESNHQIEICVPPDENQLNLADVASDRGSEVSWKITCDITFDLSPILPILSFYVFLFIFKLSL
jgi:hypothetical protein